MGVMLFKQASTHGVKDSVFIVDDDSPTLMEKYLCNKDNRRSLEQNQFKEKKTPARRVNTVTVGY